MLSRARQWASSVEWLDEPDEIDLEIIPPTDGSAGALPAPGAGWRTRSAREEAAQCQALAYLAEALRAALSEAPPKRAEG